MNLPPLHGIIRRRMLVNFRIDPEVMQRQVPEPFKVTIINRFAIGGICLIRLEQMRMGCAHIPIGMASENAAHRIAVEWTDEDGVSHEGVYVPRRDTNSKLNALTGGRFFPGDYRHASFNVTDEHGSIDFNMASDDGEAQIRLKASETDAMPSGSVFGSIENASAFFQRGSLGYSKSCSGDCFDGMTLDTEIWSVSPLDVEQVFSSYFASESFPPGSVEFDCALLMRDIPHSWTAAPAMKLKGTCAA